MGFGARSSRDVRNAGAARLNPPYIDAEKKPGHAGPAQSLVDTKVDNHLPEGNSWLHHGCQIWEDVATGCLQRAQSMEVPARSSNTEARMPAMRAPRGLFTGLLRKC